MFLGQRYLILMAQVQIVDAADERLQARLLQRRGEGRHERRLPCALDPVQADEEGFRRGLGLVDLETREDEGDAVWGLVVHDHRGGGRWLGGRVGML